MTYDITSPTGGHVSLDLTWDEAEVVTRALGLVNSGNLKSVAPNLYDFVIKMVELVGRNQIDEANKYLATYSVGQVWIDPRHSENRHD